MTLDRRLLAAGIGLALVLAACGSGTSGPSEAAATEAPTGAAATEAPTEAPGSAEAPTEAATDDGGASGPLNDLAATLPAEAGGVTFERAGYDGDQLGIYGAAAGLNSEELDPILTANGKSLNDVNFAIATSTGGTGGMIYAIQIEGLDASTFAGPMGMDTSSMPAATLGGKQVYGQAAGGFGAWTYLKDDTMYIVVFADEPTATAIFEQLP